ncbi:hypothetical protein JCM1841_004610 [Sporobolomyces salmonicolor]
MVIRRVCLDAFGTLFSPRRPVFEQYAQVARQHGLTVDEGLVKDGFKQAFKQWARSHPLYGKHSDPPLDSSAWWAGVIQDTFRFAGVPPEELAPVHIALSTALVQRFWGEEGYSLHSDALPFLRSLRMLPSPSSDPTSAFPPPAIVSNTDRAVAKILRNLGVTEDMCGNGGIRASDIWTTWELEKEKKDVRFWEEVLRRLRRTSEKAGGPEPELRADEVLVVGDELLSDYETPRKAGFRSLLLRRPSAEGQHARASHGDEDDGKGEVASVRDLMEVVDWIRNENGR